MPLLSGPLFDTRCDELTGLATRATLYEAVAATLERGDAGAAILFCDLDDFKLVNDGLGHATGDALLAEVARRLVETAGLGDVVARVGGDEFAVLTVGAAGEDGGIAAAERLRAVLAEPFELAGQYRRIRVSIGCRAATPDSSDPAGQARALVRDADRAMYEAKRDGKDRVKPFSPATRAALLRRVDLEHELRLALDQGALTVVYQPQVDLRSGRMVGVEALVRWSHPRLGTLSPDEFVPLAEETGLVGELGAQVLDRACHQLAAWQAAGRCAGLSLSVNVSVHQLADPGFPERAEATLRSSGVRPQSVSLELTETALMQAGEGPLEVLRALKALGLYISMDDFGTGFSSLAALKRLPVEVLKVDRSFVAGLGPDAEDSAIVATVMSLAHAMGLHVVAEGVETPLQASELVALGCEVAQGFLYSPGVCPAEVPGLEGRPAAQWATARRPSRARRRFIEEMLHQIGVPRETG